MILSLQYLRGVAAMMVVAFHAAGYLARMHGEKAGFPFTAGVSGVDLFFVVSGFVIVWTTLSADATPGSFLRKRLVRVVPLYWLLTLLVAAVALLRPALLSTTAFDAGHLVASLFFLPVAHPVLNEALPVLIPGWTLNYEMAFYALFGVSLFLPQRWRVPAVLAVLVATVSVRQIIPYRIATAFYTMPLILEFGAGMVIAKVYAAGVRLPALLAAAAILVGSTALLAMAGTGIWRSLASGIPAALIVAGAVFYERASGLRRVPALLLLGDASYSIYLTHVLAMPIFAKAWTAGELGDTGLAAALFMAAALAVATGCGILVHLAVERPLLAVLRPRRKPPAALTREWQPAGSPASPGPAPSRA